MIVLAIDTAGADCAAGLYDTESGRLLAAACETIGKGHAERLMAVLDRALDAAGLPLAAVGRIAVTVGPGSFTGIRVGVAAARGLALALGIDAAGVSTLAVLAAAHLEKAPGGPVMAAIDARRGEVYAQVFSARGEPLSEAAALTPEAAAGLARRHGAAVTGSAGPLLGGEEAGPDRFPPLLIARLGAEQAPQKPKPLYLRGPDAKPQAGFSVSRL